MWYGVGIDLGTSFTSAAVATANGARMVPLSPDIVVPSIAAPGSDGTVLTGVAAEKGTADPAMVARGFKRRLGDPTRLQLGDASYSPATLMAAQLRDVLGHVATLHGAPPATIALTCPAIWGPYRREQFAEVPRLAGVTDCSFITEPEAAATHYTNERRLGNGEIIAVYDLGGGTFDTTILRVTPHGMEILGTPEGIEHMGGIDFDQTLLAHIDDRLDGAISALDPEDPAIANALADIQALVTHVKEQLSIEPDLSLTIPLPTGDHQVTVSRLDLNAIIKPSITLTTDALHRTITSAGLTPRDVTAILLAGGSSRIPLIHQTLSEHFNKPIRATLHPKHTVALGAASTTTRSPRLVQPAATKTAAPANHAQPQPPLQTPPPLPTKPTKPGGNRSRWLIPLAAVLAVITAVAVVVMAVAWSDTPNTSTNAPLIGTQTPASNGATLQLYDGKPEAPWVAFVGSEQEGWTGTKIGPEGAAEGPITARITDQGGLEVSWEKEGQAQVYLQTLPDAGGQDLSGLLREDGALVFDATVAKVPMGQVSMQVHCTFPCYAKIDVTKVFKQLPVGKRTTVKIPLRCFAENRGDQWDPTRINTPFLVNTGRPFKVTFGEMRWVGGAAKDPAAISCDLLG